MAEAIIQTRGLWLTARDGLVYGPLDMAVPHGAGAMVTCLDLDVLRRLMRCLSGREKPEGGAARWAGGLSPDGEGWSSYDFYRKIGYVDRESQLVGNLSLMDNLMLFFSYAQVPMPEAEARARRILDDLELESYERGRADRLPEPRRRLGLYALALCRAPRLMLMERPNQFLDNDFLKVWDLILRKAAAGMAYIVFDRTRTIYDKTDFEAFFQFRPGRL